MTILEVGSGGREHAFVWKLANDGHTVYCAPGNAGTAEQATNVPIRVTEIKALRDFALAEKIDLIVVGPEGPLAEGIVDVCTEAGLTILGPKKEHALLESDKIWARKLMKKLGVPSPGWQSFNGPSESMYWLNHQEEEVGWVVKLPDLRGGKGVTVCHNRSETRNAVNAFNMSQPHLIETLEIGREVSAIYLCSGQDFVLFPPAQDYKHRDEGAQGPMTGGMGGYCPADHLTPELQQFCAEKIITPVLHELQTYKGFLYAGLMLTEEGPKVLEFNVRFGDPEAQVTIPRLDSDLGELLYAAATGHLNEVTPVWNNKKVVTVVLVDAKYPGKVNTGAEITINEPMLGNDVTVFHAGTTRDENGVLRTAGGRVLNVTAVSDTFDEALENVYDATYAVNFSGIDYRTDIADEICEK